MVTPGLSERGAYTVEAVLWDRNSASSGAGDFRPISRICTAASRHDDPERADLDDFEIIADGESPPQGRAGQWLPLDLSNRTREVGCFLD
ncbi:MAG TPA: hypothetical protein VFG22_09495 [Polyangiales bacterium]|nr:hypothetical protein [Polyangiales bacterium]